MSTQICVTGIGICSPIGNSTDAVVENLRNGLTGIREHTGIFQDRNIWAGLADTQESTPANHLVDRAALLAMQSARSAWHNAFSGVHSRPEGSKVALILGTSHGGRSQIDYCLENPETFQTGEASQRILETSPHFRQTEFVAAGLGIHGPVATISTACSSSSAAVLYGIDLLKSRKVDYVLAGGVDGFSKLTYAGFRSLGAVSDGPCGPFSDRIGISLGEGSAVVVLERLEEAQQRGAEIWAEIYGAGSSWDCYHITEPEPAGEGLLRALEMAALRSDVESEYEFGYTSLHGTGTRANDAAETLAVKRFFGHRAVPPASSSKSFTGHTLGASGVIGLVFSILGMRHDFLPPTVNFGGARAGCDLDYVPNISRVARIDRFSAQSAGFGGVNVVVMGGRQRTLAPDIPDTKARIAVSGMGVVSATGIGVEAFRESLLAGRTGIGPIDRFDVSALRTRFAGLVRNFEPRKIAPTLNLRRVDLCFQYAAVAVAEALASSRIAARGIEPSRIGLVVGTTRGAVHSFEHSMTSALGGMWDKVGPIYFPNLVMSSLGGYVSKMFTLQGAASTLVCRAGGGLQAIIHAAELLTHNPTQDAVVVVLADELSPLFFKMFDESGKLSGRSTVEKSVYDDSSSGLMLGEGAAAFVLEKCADNNAEMHSVSISGYGMTSDSQPGGGFQLSGARFSDSMKQSIQQAAISPDDIHLIYTHGTGLPCQDQRELRSLAGVVNCAVPLGCVLPSTGLAESASSGFAMVAALLSLRHDEAYPIPGHDASICDWNFIHTQPISVSPRNVLVTASAESGNNSALVLSKSN